MIRPSARQNLPGMLAALAMALVYACAATPEATAQSAKRQGSTVKLRIAGTLGTVDYVSTSPASNSVSSFESVLTSGNIGELEFWAPGKSRSAPKRFGLIIQGDSIPILVGDKVTRDDSLSASVAYRFSKKRDRSGGQMGFMPTLGVSVQHLGEVRTNPQTLAVDRVIPAVVGMKLGMRWRTRLDSSLGFETALSWTQPFSLLGVDGSRVFETSGTRTYTLESYVTLSLGRTVDLGGGVYYKNSRFTYRLSNLSQAQDIRWTSKSVIGFIQFWF